MGDQTLSATQSYDFARLPFMRPAGPTMPVTESYVCVPPALVIRDNEGASWTLGFRRGETSTGEFEFDVVRNGVDTGETACRIEKRAGKIRIFGAAGWRTWTGKTFI